MCSTATTTSGRSQPVRTGLYDEVFNPVLVACAPDNHMGLGGSSSKIGICSKLANLHMLMLLSGVVLCCCVFSHSWMKRINTLV
jgi:hypothetical protein